MTEQPRPAVLAVDLIEDASPSAVADESNVCRNCGRPCWIPPTAADALAAGGIAFLVCARCLYDETVPPSPARLAEQAAWRTAYHHPGTTEEPR